MPIDPSIAIRAGQRGWSLGDILQQREQGDRQDQQLAMQQQRMEAEQAERARQEQSRQSLAGLAATYQPGKGYDMQGAAGQQYREVDPSGYMGILDKMDTRKREELKAGLDDVTGAIQWVEQDPASGPARWAQVQQNYASTMPEILQIPYEQRHQVLLNARKIGDYIKDSQPKIMAIEAGGSLAAVNPQTGQPTFTVLPNPGDQAPGAPARAPQGAPRPGQVEDGYRFKGGNPADPANWHKIGGQTPSASGGFRPVGLAGETITSTYRTPEHNKRVGGVENSFHTRRGLDGKPLARDSVPPRGMSMATYAAELRRLNPHLDVINEGDHVHLEPRG